MTVGPDRQRLSFQAAHPKIAVGDRSTTFGCIINRTTKSSSPILTATLQIAKNNAAKIAHRLLLIGSAELHQRNASGRSWAFRRK